MRDATDDFGFGKSARKREGDEFEERGANELHDGIPGPVPVTVLGDR